MADDSDRAGAEQTVPLDWRTSTLTQSLFIAAALALAAAMLPGRWQLIAFAAPMLGVLGSLGWQRPGTTVRVHAEPTVLRCFEGERVHTVVMVSDGPDGADVDLTVTAVPGMQIEVAADGLSARQVTASAQRWGRYPLAARIDVVAPGGLLTATCHVGIAEVFVFPLVPPRATSIPHAEPPDRLGTHLTRFAGPGVEYADIRPYVPGDQLRTVNWPVSARRGSLHVTRRLTDRSLDVAVLVDSSAQPAGPATAATERAVEGAVQVVQSALRAGDRAGVVGLGGRRPQWLVPDIGQRQFYRVLDAVLGVSGRPLTGTLAPRAAVPAGAVVVAFSTLLDTSFALALMDLRQRGHVVVVVDVLSGYPLDAGADPLLQRRWALERSAMHRNLRVTGVEVVPWPDGVPLEQAMRLLPHARGSGRRRRR